MVVHDVRDDVRLTVGALQETVLVSGTAAVLQTESAAVQMQTTSDEIVNLPTSGRSYHLAWEPPATGPALESYIVQVGGTFTGATPTTSRALSGVAPPGAYTISVAARNSCGIGPSTASMTIVIP